MFRTSEQGHFVKYVMYIIYGEQGESVIAPSILHRTWFLEERNLVACDIRLLGTGSNQSETQGSLKVDGSEPVCTSTRVFKITLYSSKKEEHPTSRKQRSTLPLTLLLPCNINTLH